MTRLQKWNELKKLCAEHGISHAGKFKTTDFIIGEIKKIKDKYETQSEDNEDDLIRDNMQHSLIKNDDCVYAICEDKYTKTGEQTEIKLTELTKMINTCPDICNMKFNEELMTGSCVKPYFDFDYSYSSQEEADAHKKDDSVRSTQAVYAFYHATKIVIENKFEGYEDICYNEQLAYMNGLPSCSQLPNTPSNKWFAVLDSSGKKSDDKYTNSYHIILNCGIIAKNGAIIKKIIQSEAFAEQAKWRRQDKSPIEIDTAIYAGEGKRKIFRMPYGCKPNSTRIMQPINPKTIKPYDHKEIKAEQLRRFMVSIGDYSKTRIDKFKQENATKYQDCNEDEIYSLFKKMFPEEAKHHYNARQSGFGIGFTRRSGSDCPLCTDGNRKNEYDTQYHGKDSNVFIVNKNGTYFYTCRWSTKKVCLNPDKTIYKKDESEVGAEKLTSIQKMDLLIDRMNQRKDTFEEEKIARFTENVHHSSAKYVSDIPELIDSIMNKTESIIAVSANMGEGKTRMIAECLCKLAKQNPDDKMLITSLRIALTKKYKVDFPAFTSYLDKEENQITDNRIICQLDSLNRINWTNNNAKSCRILVLDEADQQLDHLVADTYTKSPKVADNIEKLKYLIKYAEQIVLLSANITPREIKWIKSIRRDTLIRTIEINENGEEVESAIAHHYDKSTKIFINKNPDAQKFTYRITPKKDVILAKISEDLKAKKRVYLAHNGSVKSIEAVKRQFKEYNSIAIHSESINDDNVIMALENPNEEWGKYNLVIASPSVQSGVSYDIENTFDAVYGIIGSSSNKSGDACQMTRRVRHPISKTIYVSIERMNNQFEPTDKKQLLKAIIKNRTQTFKRVENLMDFSYNQYGILELKESQYLDWYLTVATCHNFDKANYARQFILHQLEYGNIVESAHKEDPIDKLLVAQERANNKNAKKEITNEHTQALRDAELICDEDANELLEQRINLNKEQRILLEKHRIHNRYKLNTELPHQLIDYKTLADPKTEKLYRNRETYQNGDIQTGLTNIAEMEMNRELYNRRHTDIEKKTEGLIASSLSQKYRYEKHKIIAEWMSIFDIKSYEKEDILKKDGNMRIYTDKEFRAMVEKIANEYLLTDKSACLNIKKSKALTFRSALDKINAIFVSEFGFKFGKNGSRKVYVYATKLTNYMEFNPAHFTGLGIKKELPHTQALTKMNLDAHIGNSDVSNIIMNLLF